MNEYSSNSEYYSVHKYLKSQKSRLFVKVCINNVRISLFAVEIRLFCEWIFPDFCIDSSKFRFFSFIYSINRPFITFFDYYFGYNYQ